MSFPVKRPQKCPRNLQIRVNNACHYFARPPVGIINRLRFIYFYIRYQWSIPDGPVFMVKLWMWILDHLCGRLYSVNQNQFVGVIITRRCYPQSKIKDCFYDQVYLI